MLHEKLAAGKEYYEIRLESIGGLGANLCGKMLGELGVKYLDLNSSSFSSYGSEKTGTPVRISKIYIALYFYWPMWLIIYCKINSIFKLFHSFNPFLLYC